MSRWSGSGSPSPENQADVISYRSSRAESEAPQRRHHKSSSRSDRSSRGQSVTLRKLENSHFLCVSPAVISPFGGWAKGSDGNKSLEATRSSEKKKKRSSIKRSSKCAATVGNTSSPEMLEGCAAFHLSISPDRQLFNSTPSPCSESPRRVRQSPNDFRGPFVLVQKLSHPFDAAGRGVYTSNASGEDHSGGYAAADDAPSECLTGDKASCGTAQQYNGVPGGAVSAMSLCVIPGPLHAVLALGVGDTCGRVNYCELALDPIRDSQSIYSPVRRNISAESTKSQSQTDESPSSLEISKGTNSSGLRCNSSQFQRPSVCTHSHQAFVEEVDCLTSVNINQSIKSFCFLQHLRSPSTISYLVASERVVKLFRVPRNGFSPLHAFPAMELVMGPQFSRSRFFPYPRVPSSTLPVRIFSGCHTSPIQGISVCCDENSFLSADDLQVFWWDIERSDASGGVCIGDFRPNSGFEEDVEEFITASGFHPQHNSLFFVSRSSGVLNIGDLRDCSTGRQRRYTSSMQVTLSDECSTSSKVYREFMCIISDAGFVGANHIVTRDYLSLKLWDLRRPDKPYASLSVMSYVEPYLDFLYDCDAIFDKFPVAVDHVSRTIVTGLYDGAAAVWQPLRATGEAYEEIPTYYKADPLSLLCEVEDGGQTTLEELQQSFSSLLNDGANAVFKTTGPPACIPRIIANKVSFAAISDGGNSFSTACDGGRCVFLYERLPFS
ncbi:hypothetical protein ERJ75_001826100 [Trypanosoma vivax]|uniref:Serine/threonine-protein phosphatase 2A 55 kDa regulatory subunit B n=1 Tax=Trypanosoma vivax (strain Y486) TaxID=1055687 RepID=G0U8Z4_TRYVY|nr:hypothetical protein TRVL_03473 [Trypanosoma vivax]KAH8603376.1 hypothetical protein ERJ75_001826100 [Trypanosoma vivax]CCC54076.1 conserved hypothetical protein [Trypanosoma vivax Y486]